MSNSELAVLLTTQQGIKNLSLGVIYDRQGRATPLLPDLHQPDYVILSLLSQSTPSFDASLADLGLTKSDLRHRLRFHLEKSLEEAI